MGQWRLVLVMSDYLTMLWRKIERHSLSATMCGAFAFLYLSFFRWPCVPILNFEDQTPFLIGAGRMLEGQVIYRDYFDLIAPGLTVLDLAFFKIFGPHCWIPNVMLVLVGLGLTWIILVISRRVLSGVAALLPAGLFVVFDLGEGFDNTHHWYSALCVLCAVAIVMERRSPARLAAAGAMCGLASFFTQTQGAFFVAGLAFFLGWEGRRERLPRLETIRRLFLLLAPYFSTVFITLSYFLWKAGFGRLLFCLVEFNLKYLSNLRDSDTLAVIVTEFPEMTHWNQLPDLARYLFIRALIPFVYVGVWIVLRKRISKVEQESRLMLLAIAGIFSFGSVVRSPTTFRLWTVAPLGLILLVWLLSFWCQDSRIPSIAAGVGILCCAIVGPLQTQTSPMQLLNLPRGRVALEPANYAELLMLLRYTHPGESVLALTDSGAIFPMDLRGPTEVHGFTTNGFTRPEQVRQVVAALEAQAVPIVLSDARFGLRQDALAYPEAMEPPRGNLRALFHRFKVSLMRGDQPNEDNLGPLRDYIRAHYGLALRPEDQNSQTEIWERNPAPQTSPAH